MEVTQEAAELLTAGASRVTVVADREADLYESSRCARGVRSADARHHNRMLADGTRLVAGTRKPVKLGGAAVQLPAAPGRAARDGELALCVPRRSASAEAQPRGGGGETAAGTYPDLCRGA